VSIIETNKERKPAMKTREMLDALLDVCPETEANIGKCREAASACLQVGDGGELVAEMHELFREAETAFVKAFRIMVALEKAKRDRREAPA